MNCRTVIAALLFSVAIASPPQSLAAETALIETAIERTKAALAEKHDAHAFIVHLRNALRYANQALHERHKAHDEKAQERLRQSRPRLRQAIADARTGNLGKARHDAEIALDHLESAGK